MIFTILSGIYLCFGIHVFESKIADLFNVHRQYMHTKKLHLTVFLRRNLLDVGKEGGKEFGY